ncbi:uncharacterized protein LOC9648412 isoform X1 [Selaginella moellendorffii]|uniref:uncharacterized protein LOC9648412 isoform X1 n=1 Tax=Selaginella moellendorffii TaxID=88036 RepID=UPI000D1CE58E|nr:uncharacterized protein LOC9648412 isoform X1 [Selaginella moellendorffii]XP_024523603.1 uncharacterized protein LOC9648412 isoform X1 [Selaginella moellendorffii]XP_024523605.1 uncharacterized protein LOC9648412 isoform X1 [Selaginella moellendorffii]XP_024523606.1 uncharacterized protein LOC9648412 isoform X1 [Selaginella moellendorffii]|eukprot:XP_002994296.2 uncharacterized protein LOC9648412 isoform X1 [Selaginella moellendorffii]
MGKNRFYAVRQGRQPGIYTSWMECRKQVDGFAMAEYKSFSLKSEAKLYLSSLQPQQNSKNKLVHLLQYDGASKGNPGKAGAGALLRDPDGSVLQELRIGLGTATNNFAEYQGLILGLKGALAQNVTRIRVQGDSNLVCKQVAGIWKVNKDTLKPLHAEAQSLSKKFTEFTIEHVVRELNSAADDLANKAIDLKPQEVVKDVKCIKLQISEPSHQITTKKNKKEVTEESVYVLAYDGASKGNPGKAGAGALLRNPKGSVIEKLYMGLGTATNNVAEYEALILGLQAALDRNVTSIQVFGDSNLVCKQVAGEWAVRHEGLRALHAQVQALSMQFTTFSIHHVDREMNTEADALANKGITLPCRTIVTRPTRKSPPHQQHQVAESSTEMSALTPDTTSTVEVGSAVARKLSTRRKTTQGENAEPVGPDASDKAGANAKSQSKRNSAKNINNKTNAQNSETIQRKVMVATRTEVLTQQTCATKNVIDAAVGRYVTVDAASRGNSLIRGNQVPSKPLTTKVSYKSYHSCSTIFSRFPTRPAACISVFRSLSTIAAVALVRRF